MKQTFEIDQLPIHSKPRLFNQVIYLIGVAMCVFFVYVFGFDTTDELTLWSFNGIAVLLSSLFGLTCLVAPWMYYQLIIDQDSIEFIRFGGLRRRMVLRRDLRAYEVLELPRKYTSGRVLKLYTHDSCYNIEKQMYANYWAIEFELIKNLPATQEQAKKNSARTYYTKRIAAIFLLILFGGTSVVLVKRAFYFNIDTKHLVQLPLTLSEQPAIKLNTADNPKPYLYLPIKEYPALNFDISGIAYNATDARKFVLQNRPGDSILVRIGADEYASKITREKPIGFGGDLFDNGTRITVYELSKPGGSSYLSTSKYISYYRASYYTLVMICMPLMVIALIAVWWKDFRKPA